MDTEDTACEVVAFVGTILATTVLVVAVLVGAGLVKTIGAEDGVGFLDAPDPAGATTTVLVGEEEVVFFGATDNPGVMIVVFVESMSVLVATVLVEIVAAPFRTAVEDEDVAIPPPR